MRQLILVAAAVLLVASCSDQPVGPQMDLDNLGGTIEIAEKGGSPTLATGRVRFLAGVSYQDDATRARFWRYRTARFNVSASAGTHVYTRYARDGRTVNGTMTSEVSCAGSYGPYAAFAGPIVDATGGYTSRIGQDYIVFVEDGGSSGPDRYRANYGQFFAGNPDPCDVVEELTDGDDEWPQSDWWIRWRSDGDECVSGQTIEENWPTVYELGGTVFANGTDTNPDDPVDCSLTYTWRVDFPWDLFTIPESGQIIVR
jgi:hypothetical protein